MYQLQNVFFLDIAAVFNRVFFFFICMNVIIHLVAYIGWCKELALGRKMQKGSGSPSMAYPDQVYNFSWMSFA